jgi:hypothetical protein
MPPKAFTCQICGKDDLTKPKSYALPGGGRACREHEEAQQGHATLVQQQEKAKEKQREKYERMRNRWERHAIPQLKITPVCMCCGKDGLKPQAYFMHQMIGLELLGDSDIQDNEEFKQALINLLTMGTPIFPVDIPKGKIKQLKWQYQTGAEFMGFACLCMDCINSLGLENPIPIVTWDQL